jgi:hypothetical protein
MQVMQLDSQLIGSKGTLLPQVEFQFATLERAQKAMSRLRNYS